MDNVEVAQSLLKLAKGLTGVADLSTRLRMRRNDLIDNAAKIVVAANALVIPEDAIAEEPQKYEAKARAYFKATERISNDLEKMAKKLADVSGKVFF